VDRLDLKVNRVQLDPPAHRGTLEHLAILELQVLRDNLDHKGQPATWVLLDQQVRLELLGSKVALEPLGHRAFQGQWEYREHLGSMELMERLDPLDQLELPDRMDL
jgi:hypothetical protein